MGQDSSVGIATRYGLDGLRIESGGSEIFRTCPDRPWDPPSLLGLGIDHPPPSSAKVKERVELYSHSPFGPLWPCSMVNFNFYPLDRRPGMPQSLSAKFEEEHFLTLPATIIIQPVVFFQFADSFLRTPSFHSFRHTGRQSKKYD